MAPVLAVAPEMPKSPVWACKIDFVSATSGEFHVIPQSKSLSHLPVAAEAATVFQSVITRGDHQFSPDTWREGSPRSGYTRAAYHSTGARYFAGHATAKPLIELPGAACDCLRAIARLHGFVGRYCESVTRLDLAGDLETVVTPHEFVSLGYSALVRTASSVTSATGSTEYLGSPKSDRFVRVYRYAAPHPRSNALRVEVVLRRELAKAGALALAGKRVDAVWRSALQQLSFKHPCWSTSSSDKLARLTLPNEPTSASRMRWLEKQIRPAVISAHKAGLIDLRSWLDDVELATTPR